MSLRYMLARLTGGTINHVFRRGPVPFTACRRASAHGPFRAFRTAAELKANASVRRDPDCAENRIRVRAARLHGGGDHGLPYIWDDLPYGRRGDSWKHYRGHQSRKRGTEDLG